MSCNSFKAMTQVFLRQAEVMDDESAEILKEFQRLFGQENPLDIYYTFKEDALCSNEGNKQNAVSSIKSDLRHKVQHWNLSNRTGKEEAIDKT